jgi:hypothetical protein
MQLEQLLPVDELGSMIESGRRNIANVDLSGVPQAVASFQRTAVETARDTIPGPWARPRSRWRWPLVGLFLVMATAAAGFLFIGPALRRRKATELPTDAMTPQAPVYSEVTYSETLYPAEGAHDA